MNKLSVAVATLLFAAPLTQTVADVPAPFAKQVDELFTQWDKPDSAGCALGVIKDGQLVYKRGYGSANLETGTKLSTDSVFYIASTSKQFAAASIMLLVRQGKLSLDDDIRKFIPEVPRYAHPILVRHLVYQTSGLRDYLELMLYAGRSHEDEFGNADAVRWVSLQKNLNFDPGSKWEYSNSNYALMAEIVGRVTNTSLRRFAEDNIFKPLGMTHSHFDDDHREVIKGRVISYEEKTPGNVRQLMKNIDAVGDGNLLTTVEDLARWDQNYYDETVGGKGFTKLMTTLGKLDDGTETQYAAGLFPATYRGVPVVHHAGGFLGFRTQMVRFPEQRVSVICLCNLGNINPVEISWKIADLYLQQDGVKLGPPEQKKASEMPPEPKPITLTAAQLKEYAGSYHGDEVDSTQTLSIQDGKLVWPMRRMSGVLLPVGKDEFYSSEMMMLRIKFSRDAKGKVNGFSIDSGRIHGLGFKRL
ncbi:serine hydrolase [Steroidobacter sp.]|uniref:serine hydrolase n=1 Tax=Steroidobacter sp. TaxID=1978227 RepID=UPI001A4F48DA|nr:serine hydrolase [Steroidobacter sp.]MBL8270213.1 serine hydrolase [Steroidobacter sp.]